MSATETVKSPVELPKYSLSNSTMWMVAVLPVSILIQLLALLLTHDTLSGSLSKPLVEHVDEVESGVQVVFVIS